MPELPEVETVRRGLLPVMEGQRIETVDIRRPDLRWPFPAGMKQRLDGAGITALRRRSKYLLADLDTQETLIIHLGMSGRMLISGVAQGAFHHERALPAKHDHVIFDMDQGARVTFNDARRFGMIDLAPSAQLSGHRLLAHLGPEPLGNSFNADYLFACMKGRRTPVKSLLLDQRVVAGLGNIYVCEALWLAKVSPVARSSDLDRPAAEALVPAIRDVLNDAIAAGGSSLRDYRAADGELGYFQHSFAVYGREGQPCSRNVCAGEVMRIVQSGRSSFYCPLCQGRG